MGVLISSPLSLMLALLRRVSLTGYQGGYTENVAVVHVSYSLNFLKGVT